MNIKNTQSIQLHHFILITLLSSLVISITHADDSDDKRQYGYGYMGHMGSGYMGSGHMMGYGHMGSGPMGYGRMGIGHMGYGRFGIGTMGMQMLDLSDSQRKSIRDIHKGTRTQQLALHDELAEHADELYSLYKKDKPNAKKIGQVYKKIFDIKRTQIELGITTKNKVYDVLTDKQKKKLKEWKSSERGYPLNRSGRGMRHMMQ